MVIPLMEYNTMPSEQQLNKSWNLPMNVGFHLFGPSACRNSVNVHVFLSYNDMIRSLLAPRFSIVI